MLTRRVCEQVTIAALCNLQPALFRQAKCQDSCFFFFLAGWFLLSLLFSFLHKTSAILRVSCRFIFFLCVCVCLLPRS